MLMWRLNRKIKLFFWCFWNCYRVTSHCNRKMAGKVSEIILVMKKCGQINPTALSFTLLIISLSGTEAKLDSQIFTAAFVLQCSPLAKGL